MKASDITLATLIILGFIALFMVNYLSIGIANIKKNWPKYRCNPSVMPFAETFGHDANENFTYCIQNMQSDYMGYLTAPMKYSMGVMGTVANSLANSLQSVRAMFDYIRSQITGIVQSIFGVFLNILIEFQKMTIMIKDIFSKLFGILSTIMYMMSGTSMAIRSLWAGPTGKLVRAVGKIKF